MISLTYDSRNARSSHLDTHYFRSTSPSDTSALHAFGVMPQLNAVVVVLAVTLTVVVYDMGWQTPSITDH